MTKALKKTFMKEEHCQEALPAMLYVYGCNLDYLYLYYSVQIVNTWYWQMLVQGTYLTPSKITTDIATQGGNIIVGNIPTTTPNRTDYNLINPGS